VQDKVWVSDPDGAAWEVYTVLGDAPNLAPPSVAEGGGCTCCGMPATNPAEASIEAEAAPAGSASTSSCC
jgi:hypothetical protein